MTLGLTRTPENDWSKTLYDLTPVELLKDSRMAHTGATGTSMHFKREDKYAPLGQGGINGSKLRQCIWLASEASKAGYTAMVNGTVVGSPQSPMGAAVFRHFGMRCVTVLGATKARTCVKHPMIRMASWFGSEFAFVGSGYNSTIQPRCRQIRDAEGAFYLEYGITLDHADNRREDVADFHILGGEQAANIPEGVKRLVIPFGSANSATSVLTGLLEHGFKDLEEIHLIGIGPHRMRYLQERVDIAGDLYGGIEEVSRNVTICHYDLHGTNWVRYNDLMPETYAGVALHPRYEGKVMRYLKAELPHLLNPETLFWIVGSAPSIEAMAPHCPELGPPGQPIKLYEGEHP